MDGVDISLMKREDFRQYIALVPQDPMIFADTALANIAFGRPDASRLEIESAAQAAAAHDFIMSLPDGYNTKLG